MSVAVQNFADSTFDGSLSTLQVESEWCLKYYRNGPVVSSASKVSLRLFVQIADEGLRCRVIMIVELKGPPFVPNLSRQGCKPLFKLSMRGCASERGSAINRWGIRRYPEDVCYWVNCREQGSLDTKIGDKSCPIAEVGDTGGCLSQGYHHALNA